MGLTGCDDTPGDHLNRDPSLLAMDKEGDNTNCLGRFSWRLVGRGFRREGRRDKRLFDHNCNRLSSIRGR